MAPAFEHHPDLPALESGGTSVTVLVGDVGGVASPATTFSPLVGADVRAGDAARSSVPLEPGFEHAVLVVDGSVVVAGERLSTGDCVYLGRDRRELVVAGEPSGRFLLLGGEPFTEPLVMWWNFVGRTADEIAEARADWEAGRRFGSVAGSVTGESGDRVPAPPLPPGRLTARR